MSETTQLRTMPPHGLKNLELTGMDVRDCAEAKPKTMLIVLKLCQSQLLNSHWPCSLSLPGSCEEII
jgi:hypothetical protein